MRRIMRREWFLAEEMTCTQQLTVVRTPTTCPKASKVAPMSSWASPTDSLQLATYNYNTTRCWEWDMPRCVWGWAAGHGIED